MYVIKIICMITLQYTGYTQKNGVVSIGIAIETAPFFCVYPVYVHMHFIK
jgi:hypothetical protein